MKIEGVIFDFNGTLFFDTHLHNQAWDIFLEKYSFQLSDVEKNQKIHGKNNVELLTTLFQRNLSSSEVEKLSIEKEDIYQSLCLKQKMELAPGTEDLLKYLMLHEIPFTIATAADLYNVKFYFKHLNLDKYFDLSKIVYSNGLIKSKPNPEIFIAAMNMLHIAPKNTLIFEDSTSGIQAAENATAGKIIIMNSTGDDYSKWSHQVIKSFAEVDRGIFL